MGMNFTTAAWGTDLEGIPEGAGQTATATVSTDPVEVWAIGTGVPVFIKAQGRTEITLEIALTTTAPDLTFNHFNTKSTNTYVAGGGITATITAGYLDGATITYPANDICTASYTIAGRGNISEGESGSATLPASGDSILFGDDSSFASLYPSGLSVTITYTPEVNDLYLLGDDTPHRTLMYVTKDTAIEYAEHGFNLDDHASLGMTGYTLEGSINVSVGNANSITVTSREVMFG